MLAALVCLALVNLATLVFMAAVARRWLAAASRRDAAYAAERRELLDRIMYMAHQPWVMPDSGPLEPEPDLGPDLMIYPELEPEATWP